MGEVVQDKVFFSRAQLMYLEKIYPEKVFPAHTTMEEIRTYMGIRSVVHFLRSKVRE